MTTITALPTPPTRQDPSNFADRADEFLSALPTFATETNAVASEVNDKYLAVINADIIAENLRGQWVTATSYALKDVYTDNGIAYIVVVSHTSTSIANDAANGKVKVYQGVLFSDLAASSGSSLVGHDATLNYVVGTLGAILNDVCINVKMFPWLAKGDGITDDTAAIQAALNYAGANALPAYGITLYLPRGTYKTTGTLTIPLYVNILGENTEGVIIDALFNGDAFQDALVSTQSVLYYTRIEEITVYKSDTSGAGNTTGNCITYRHGASFCSFKRLRLFGGTYGIFAENLGYSLWNTFDQVTMYYQSTANVYLGQGSNVTRFNACNFAKAPIGLKCLGTSFTVNLFGCAFEDYSSYAIENDNAQINVYGGYVEQFTSISVARITTGSTGTISFDGTYLKGSGGGYIGTLDGAGFIRLTKCLIAQFTLNPPFLGAYATNFSMRDNDVSGGSNTLLKGTESGTFTPALSPTVLGDFSIAYSKQYGRWTKEGRRVTVDIEIVTSAFTWTTASGYLRIQGIPYIGSTTSGAQSKGAVEVSGLTKAGYTQFASSIDYTNNSQIILMASGSGVASTTVNAADMPSGGVKVIRLSLTYEVAY